MTLTQQAERRTESLHYYSPVWYALSGCARVTARSGRYRAEVALSGLWAAIDEAEFVTIEAAAAAALAADRFST